MWACTAAVQHEEQGPWSIVVHGAHTNTKYGPSQPRAMGNGLFRGLTPIATHAHANAPNHLTSPRFRPFTCNGHGGRRVGLAFCSCRRTHTHTHMYRVHYARSIRVAHVCVCYLCVCGGYVSVVLSVDPFASMGGLWGSGSQKV